MSASVEDRLKVLEDDAIRNASDITSISDNRKGIAVIEKRLQLLETKQATIFKTASWIGGVLSVAIAGILLKVLGA